LSIRSALFTALLLVTSCTQQSLVDQPAAQRIDQLITNLADDGDFAGAVLIAKQGEIVLRKGYGFADIERSVPNTPETTFQLASISKLFTRQLVLEDVANGALELERTLDAHVPDFMSAQRIRLRHLLNHTSGIADANNRDTRLSDPSLAAVERSRQEMLKIFQEEALLFDPGTNQHYSSPGYALLAYIEEDLHGTPFSQLLQERIFAPLGMTATTYDADVGAAIPYRERDGRLEKAPPIDCGHYIGAACVHSNVDDLYHWYGAVYRDQLLGDIATGEFALGSHYGHSWGSTTGFFPMPSEDIVVIVLSNLGHAPVQTVIPSIYSILLEPLVRDVDGAELDELQGNYRVDFIDSMEHVAVVRRSGNHLVFTATVIPDGPEFRFDLLSMGVDRFLMRQGDDLTGGVVTFQRDPHGAPASLVVDNAGVQFTGIAAR
jgi:CubicO group peptidase (beta-lactamase class C family)